MQPDLEAEAVPDLEARRHRLGSGAPSRLGGEAATGEEAEPGARLHSEARRGVMTVGLFASGWRGRERGLDFLLLHGGYVCQVGVPNQPRG
jgi:hypothetical protein